MELRSRQRYLMEKLKNAGLYEEGMHINEMRELVQAMDMSVNMCESVEIIELERAILESELDFVSNQNTMHSSTMIGSAVSLTSNSCVADGGSSNNQLQSIDSLNYSPECLPIQIEVEAVVHHALNWSPGTERRTALKRIAIEVDDSTECDAKRSHQIDQDENEQESHSDSREASTIYLSVSTDDSGVNWDELSSSISTTSSIPSIGEMPDRMLASSSSVALSDFSSSLNESSEETNDHESI